MLILGLDVSTSCTGYCLIDTGAPSNDVGSQIVILSCLPLTKCKSFWKKTEAVADCLKGLAAGRRVDVLALEEPLLGFSKGMSSAGTITTLMRFNGIVSYIGRSIYGVDPTYVSAAHARKLCGVKLQKTSVVGLSQKEQVFRHMCSADLRHVSWPMKKDGTPADIARDMCDAYVIARAASLEAVHK